MSKIDRSNAPRHDYPQTGESSNQHKKASYAGQNDLISSSCYTLRVWLMTFTLLEYYVVTLPIFTTDLTLLLFNIHTQAIHSRAPTLDLLNPRRLYCSVDGQYLLKACTGH
jgi:hypothetical protein